MNPKLFDHTILAADATETAVANICAEALKYGFMSVCVNSYYTAFVRDKLNGSDVKVCTVVGFPLGQMSTDTKCAETKLAISDGAEEIDMVINVGALKDKQHDFVREDIRKVKEACGSALLKVIIEACLLTDEEKRIACQLSEEAGADFVKTSTGFSTGGATVTDVALMRQMVGDRLGVKASGGIRSREDAEKMLAAGATRLGTSRTADIVSGKSADTPKDNY
jgi:deoxyribose-phosphate aldolase